MSTRLLQALAHFAGLLSWTGAQKIGAFLGLVWFYVVRIRRKTVLLNLSRALPERLDEHVTIAKNAYRHFGISALEFFKMGKMTGSQITERVREHGLEHFETALARGRGVIVVTAHFGNFDLLACSQAARGVPLAIVSRELHGRGSNRFWMDTRESCGLTIFPEQGAARHILHWLRSGKVLGLTVDQRIMPAEGGILSPFMGSPAWTTTAPAALALRTGAALVPVRIERREDGDHVLTVEPEVQLPASRDDDAIGQLTLRINEIVATWVRRNPAHWMWLHRRFAEVLNRELE
jgi:KDO2-lipid IV(A) lauroyltransferase